jgi:tetratricopeptide (TPR) repeat protein
MKRLIIAVLASIALCGAIYEAARAGIARTLAEQAEASGEAGSADRAVRFSPSDAETHFARGALWQASEDYAQAALEFEQAVARRPRDYYLWLMLGITRDENGDEPGALLALQQSVGLAPTYAPPRWQLGNLLLRLGRTDEAFVELQAAARSNPLLMPNVIDLAWSVYGNNPQSVIEVIRPKVDSEHLALGLFFARHDRAASAFEEFRLIGKLTDPNLRVLLEELLNRRAFNEAYQVWARMHGRSPTDGLNEIHDGSFEETLKLGERGFGWQVSADVANVEMSVDPNERQAGGRSLRVEFRGNSNPGQMLLSQIVLLKPSTHYQLGFAAQEREFVSAALPVLTITDISGNGDVVLAKSAPLSPDKNGWRDFQIDFSTTAQTQAVVISLSRENCGQDPCPAFGVLWLDSLALK